MIIVKKIRESFGDNEKKEKMKLKKDTSFIALGRLEILIIMKEIRPNPNTSIKTRMKSTAEAKRIFFLSSALRTIFNDLNISFIITT